MDWRSKDANGRRPHSRAAGQPGTIIQATMSAHTEVSLKRTTHGSGTGHETGTTGEAGRIDPPTQRGEARMVNVQSIDDLARRLAALVPPGLKEARDDLAANFKSALQSGLRELDLVTREEFDVQRCVLLRTREKIEELEAQVAHLERSIGTELPRPPH